MPLDQSHKNYQWNAEAYAQHSQSQLEWATELIGKLNLRGDETLFDIGCGDGKVTAAIAGQLPAGQVIGIDSSMEMVALVKERYADLRPRVVFQHLDIRELSDKDRFDVIFSNAALHWVKRHRPILKRIAKALKPGGHILLQMGGKGNAEQVVAVVNHLIQKKWKTYFNHFTFSYGFHEPEEYTRWLKDAGLTPHRVELIEKDMRHKGREELAGWIKTTWLPYLECVPLDLRESFTESIADDFLETYPPGADQTAHLRMVRLEVEASLKISQTNLSG